MHCVLEHHDARPPAAHGATSVGLPISPASANAPVSSSRHITSPSVFHLNRPWAHSPWPAIPLEDYDRMRAEAAGFIERLDDREHG